MTQFNHRIDLKVADFPMLSNEAGRSVLVSNTRSAPTGEKANEPEVLYMHNVMPTKRGLVSVGYTESIPATVGGAATILLDDVRVIFGDLGTRFYFAVTSDGEQYHMEEGDLLWTHDTGLSHIPGLAGLLMTIGTVNGVSQIFFSGFGNYVFNEGIGHIVANPLTGLVTADILGITGANGYLIAVTEFDVAWSSLVDPRDFTPSAITGAGGGSIAGTEGVVKFPVAISTGFLIYTEANVIGAVYTGNKQYPFKLKPVENSQGAVSLDTIAYEANSASHFAYSTGGMQTVNSRSAETLLPETTDFLAGKQLEDYNEVTDTLSTTDLTATMKKKVKLISSRYLVISYGISTFTHALIYDVVLQRLGKIKHTHVDVFEYLGNATQKEIAKEAIAFVKNTGEINMLQFSVPTAIRTGVVILGKYQYIRDRHLVLHRITTENIASADTFSVQDSYSLDGINEAGKVAGVETSIVDSRSYNFFKSAVNHSFILKGKFSLSTLQMLFTIGGRR